MAKIIPFRALRPPRDVVHLVASRSYVSYTKESLCDKLENNPYTFLHIINPDWNSDELSGTDKFKAVKSAFESFRKEGVFIEEERPAFYLYEQVAHGEHFIGWVAGAAVSDYQNGVIKRHEDTLSSRESMFKEYLEVTDFNAEPVLLAYPDQPGLDDLMDKYRVQRPEYEYYTTDRHLHRLWLVFDESDIRTIEKHFEKISAVYIADGHHRSASSALLAQDIARKNPNPSLESQHFLAFFIPESRLHIWDYNRLIKDLNGLTVEAFIDALKASFKVERLSARENPKPQKKHDLALYTDGHWYQLTYDTSVIDPSDPVSDLDVHILTQKVLAPILGIHDLRTDSRIDFMDGRKELEGLQAKVDSKAFKAAFALYPVSVDQLKRVSDAGKTMPPKSTYIEPKLRSGLTVYPING